MKEFDLLCKEVEKLNSEEYVEFLKIKSLKLLASLKLITDNGIEGDIAFCSFMIGSVVADGKLSEEEYILILPLLRAFFGEDVNYEECKKIISKSLKENKEIKNTIDTMVDVFGMLSDELKEDAITVCLLICSIDGKISFKEKKWIKQLIK